VVQNKAAVATLVEGHRQFLRFVERHVESRAAAEDILQSAFVRGLEAGASLREDENVVAWFYRILRNAIIDHYRHRSATERAMEGFGREAAAGGRAEQEVHAAVCECLMPILASLKPEYRRALEIVDLDDGSMNDLAAAAGITPGNAAVRVHRARDAFRRQIRKACGTCAEHGCLDCRCGSTQRSGETSVCDS
jgi:RNA polymerase sigma-70 factor (ECF subfamily)